MATMKATIFDVNLKYGDEETNIDTKVGVIHGDWNDGMTNTNLDSSVYFWFDDVSDVVVGAETGDGDTITEIYGEPDTLTEEYEAEGEDFVS